MPNPIIFRRLPTGTGRVILPQIPKLNLKVESSSFDASTNGSNITLWSDLSAAGHNFDLTGLGLYGNPSPPTVDGTNLCNGHKTVRFGGANMIGQPNFSFAASPGIEMMAVYRWDHPSSSSGPFLSLLRNSPSLLAANPFNDNNFYEWFGVSSRQSAGSPSPLPASWFCYDVASKSDNSAFNIWANSNNFYSTAAYTYNNVQVGQQATLGGGYTGVTNLFAVGNMAAVYLWNTVLSTSERLQARAYVTQTWGIIF